MRILRSPEGLGRWRGHVRRLTASRGDRLGGMSRVEFTPEAEAAHQRTIAKRVALGIATRSDHAQKAISKRGRRVRCEECGYRTRARTSRMRRLRNIGCPDCGARLRPETWAGFDVD